MTWYRNSSAAGRVELEDLARWAGLPADVLAEVVVDHNERPGIER